jgi:hypothetical protein
MYRARKGAYLMHPNRVCVIDQSHNYRFARSLGSVAQHRSMLTRPHATTDIVAQDEDTLATYAFLLGDYGVKHWCAAVDPT